jgi:hypothetical protein
MNLRNALMGALVLATLLLGGLWLFLRHESASESLSAFQQSCIDGQRRAVTGQTLPLDDESEGKILAYCTCVAEEAGQRLSATELAGIGLGRPTDETGAKLDLLIAYCRDRAR